MATIFRPYDMSNSEKALHRHAGQEPVSVTPMSEERYDSADVCPMFDVTFEDGCTVEAFADELVTA